MHKYIHTKKKAAEPSRGNTEFSSQEPKNLLGRWEGGKGSGRRRNGEQTEKREATAENRGGVK